MREPEDDIESAMADMDSRFGPEAILRLRSGFERARYSMLILDDRRRWVTGNEAAAELLQVAQADIPWHTLDEVVTAAGRVGLDTTWEELMSSESVEGWTRLTIAERTTDPIEFSATANVFPSRHLLVFATPDLEFPRPKTSAPRLPSNAGEPSGRGRHELTAREREVITLVASGFQTSELAERLFLSPETVKSHVRNSMAKLNAHTRAHAVAIALVTGEISWEV